jgi:uncharacterized repeat protein (TIGR01451 family)
MKKIIPFIFLFCLFLPGISFAQSPLYVQINQDDSTPEKRRADFVFSNFDEITSFQFSIAYPQGELAIDSIHSSALEDFGSTNYVVDEATARVRLLWFDLAALGVTLEDGTVAFSAYFTVLNGTEHDVYVSDCPLMIEVTQAATNIISLLGDVRYECSSISGFVIIDENENCETDDADGMQGWSLTFSNENTYVTESVSNGFFNARIPVGSYTVQATPPNRLWNTCQEPFNITVTNTEPVEIRIPASKAIDCPATYVNVITPFLRRCFPGYYYIEYGNLGTTVAENASIEFILDSDLQITFSELAWSSQNDSLYTFELGDLAPGYSDQFIITVQVGCDGVALGQSHCSSAHIYPDTICYDGLWDLAYIVGETTCLGDSVLLQFRNEGDGMMQMPMDVHVIEDDVIVFFNQFQLGPQMAFEKKFPATGSTWRIHGGQGTNFPYSNEVFASIEGCDSDGDGDFSIGYLTMFTTDPEEPFLSISCVQNVGSFDPNDKLSSIKGVGTQRYVEPNTNLDYMIRFQNTGTDTAFNIRILDTLPATLDVAQLELIGSSHPFRMEIGAGGIMDFYFDDIMLVDSFTNEPASHGFIKYRIAQQENLEPGTLIQNRAGIYFDFNEPVITEYAFHTVEKDFLEIISSLPGIPEPLTLEMKPNPTSDFCIISLPETKSGDSQLNIYDLNQRLIQSRMVTGNQEVLELSEFNQGTYLVVIRTNEGKAYVGKMIVNR